MRSLTFVILINVGASFETLIFFSILFGLVDYSTVPETASLVASHIGIHVMGLAFGLISAGHQVGAALGAYLAAFFTTSMPNTNGSGCPPCGLPFSPVFFLNDRPIPDPANSTH